MKESLANIVSPEELDTNLQEETDINEKIRQAVEAIILVLLKIGNDDDIQKVRNIVSSLISQDEIFERLYRLYEEIYTIWQRLKSLVSRSRYGDEDKYKIKSRASQIINETIFQMQREVFFKIVNAKEVAEGEKNSDGPALLFPAIEKLKNSILRNIQSQTQRLRPTAIEICKSFQGISDSYARTENIKPGEKLSYDTIAQVYEHEKALFQEISGNITVTQISDTEYLNNLIKRFTDLGKIYRLKTISLKDKRTSGVKNFVQKIDILKEGYDQSVKCLKPLNVLKNLVVRFPALEKQLDFFAESHYQAKAVMQFLEEVHEEMDRVFKQYTLQSFTVIGFLRYKLNGTSHMYESIFYYYAVVQIENDIKEALEKRYALDNADKRKEFIARDIKEIGIDAIILELHQIVAKMNAANYSIHLAFLEYRQTKDLAQLKNTLQKQTALINTYHPQVKVQYKKAQKLFLDFLSDDLGSTDLISQFNSFLRVAKSSHEASLIRKSFNKLLATKKTELNFLETKLTEQFSGRLDPEKISAMALLKVRKDFQKELLAEVQKFERAQDIFIHIVKEFIKIQDEQDGSHKSDNSVIWLVQRNFTNELNQFKSAEANTFKKILRNPYLSERDLAICFLASNITPQEIESFSRLLPALPRNEFHLDSPYGRFLLDVKSMFKEILQTRGSSGAHIIEKVYEKRERMKLINNICLFLKASADPFLKKIDTEELKINHLISLERRKYQKDLNDVIKYWQYLIQEQISPGKGQRGKFNQYGAEEKQLMMKYISPEQLNLIEKQLESSYDLEGEPRLFEVESFLMEIADGLFKNFKKDLRIKAAFEKFEKGKKIKNTQYRNESYQDVLESDSFVPNVRNCMAKVVKVTRRKTIADFLGFWEYLIDQEVPASEKRKRPKVSKVEIVNDTDNAVYYISSDQLNQIWDNLDLIRTIRDVTTQNNLVNEGMPVINIAHQCFNLFKEGPKKLVLKEVEPNRLEKMRICCSNKSFERAVLSAVQT